VNRIEQLLSYKILEKTEIKELDSTGYLLKHIKSGARLVLLANEDENKVFNIAFRTPAPNDTGVPHILEHSVLCGSKNFPLKDPFVELVKGSLNTFLNAMTYPDKTMYPVASCNDKDFQNLMHVYMDAVFLTNIYDQEEIFRQEGWSYNLESPEDNLTINGVVYNEMKGAFSSPEDVLSREIQNALFPDTDYANESGGDPMSIPELTYSQFLDFHSKYYHPSNSYIYLYGNMDMEQKLDWLDKEYLCKYDEFQVDSEIKRQKPFDKPACKCIDYPIAANESEEDNTFLSYNVVVGDYYDTKLSIAFQVLEYALLNMPGAKLKTTLQDAGIGTDIYGEYNSGILQPYFSIIAKNANEKDKDRFLQIIREQLEEIVSDGFDKKTLQAGLNTIEFRTREADYGDFPKGLLFGLQIYHSWLYDDEQPFLHVQTDPIFEFLKEQIKTDYFEKILKQYFLNNSHEAVVIALPKQGLNTVNNKALEEKLKDYKESLSKEEIQELVAKTKRLRDYQEEPTEKEVLAKIPLLNIEDIKKQPEKLHLEEKNIAGVKVLHHNYHTNKIGYLTLAFKSNNLPFELIPYLGLFKSVFGVIDTKNYSYQDLSNEININTGGMSFAMSIYNDYSLRGNYSFMTEIRTKATYDKIAFPFKIITEILFQTNLDNSKRLKEIIGETKSRLQAQLSAQGNQTAALRALSYYSVSAYINDMLKGINYYEFIEDINRNFDEKKDEVVANLEKLIRYIFRPENLIISYSADNEGYALFGNAVEEFKDSLCNSEVPQINNEIQLKQLNEGFQTSSQVQYVAQAGNFADKGYQYTGALRILRIIMSYDYLWNNVRVKGGAYGCGNNYTRNGDCYLTSYRDPNLKNTLVIFKNIPKYIKNFNADDRDMTKFIIGTISEMDTPLTYSSRGTRSYSAYMCNITFEMLQKERTEVLSANQETIRGLADLVKSALDDNHICVIGNEDKVDEAKEIFNEIKRIF